MGNIETKGPDGRLRRAYENIFVAKEMHHVRNVGMYDKYSWIPKFTKGKYGSACIFDSAGKPKSAYFCLLKVLLDDKLPK